jgi:hypothetical protein
MIEIEIAYQLRNDDTPLSIALTPDQYFHSLEPGESYEKDGVPRYNHAWQYLGVSADRLTWTVLHRSGTTDSSVHRTDFFCGGRTWILHRSDGSGYEELIHSTELLDGSTHIIRIHKEPDEAWTMNTNVFIRDSGSPTEREEHYDIC